MRKLFPILFLPLFIFIACEDEEVEKCNDLVDNYNASSTAFGSDLSTVNCNAMADDLLALINEGCTESLAGSGFESWTADSVADFKALCE
tara:strand:+ start:8788 stop:9057 length:270 start_codon:yes stop_codon:yes gene_type:complete